MASTSQQPWADTPWQLIALRKIPTDPHPAHKLARLMTTIHNCFIRSINSAYNQSAYVSSAKDISSLAVFLEYWIHTVHVHHSLEERIAFPALVRLSKGQWSDASEANIQQHHQLDLGLKGLEEWCKSDLTAAGWTKELRSRIETLMATLHSHLKAEIPTLLATEKYPAADVQSAIDELQKNADKEFDMLKEGPLMLGSHDVTYQGEDGRPVGSLENVPWFVPYMSKYWLERGNRQVWRFCPCDSWGKPRKLAFGPESHEGISTS